MPTKINPDNVLLTFEDEHGVQTITLSELLESGVPLTAEGDKMTFLSAFV